MHYWTVWLAADACSVWHDDEWRKRCYCFACNRVL